MKVIGLISGTSSDGIDAALVNITKGGDSITGAYGSHLSPLHRQSRTEPSLQLIDFSIYPYPKKLQQQLIDLASGALQSVSEVCHLNFYLGEQFANAAIQLAKKANTPLSEIKLIGSHGQTVHHLPVPKKVGKWSVRSTLQIGEPSVIAERTGITTVADFRPRDMAAGGEGAPLTPFFHYHLFGHHKKSRVILNMGGISNVTYLKAKGALHEVRAFDTGPANMLIDGLVHALTGKQFDLNGKIARAGVVHLPLLSELMRHPFIHKKPPKSTGREVFGASMVAAIQSRNQALSYPDLIATVTAFTAAAITHNIKQFILKEGPVDEVIAGGGGVRNSALMQFLAKNLSPIPLQAFEEVGFDSRAIEAMTFALLAYNTWHGKPSNIPSVTGAVRPVVLGKIIPGKST